MYIDYRTEINYDMHTDVSMTETKFIDLFGKKPILTQTLKDLYFFLFFCLNIVCETPWPLRSYSKFIFYLSTVV